MRRTLVIAVMCVISMYTSLRAQTPSTMPTTTPAGHAAKLLGVVIIDKNQFGGPQEAIPSSGGNLVVNVVLISSRAEKMGLKRGDAIIRINGQEMRTGPDVMSAVQAADLLKIELIRDQKSLTIEEKVSN